MLLVKTKIGVSPIHGIGLFAEEYIPVGRPVWKFLHGFDLIVPADVVGRLAPPARQQFLEYCYIDVSTGEYILCSDDARFFNHSDDPNTAGEGTKGEDVDVATRDIQPGEELTCDYRTFDLDWKRKLGVP